MDIFRDAVLTRRDAVQFAALAAGLAAFRPRGAWAAQDGLISKAIPSTGEKLPVIGIGTNAFNESIKDELRQVLTRFSALGASVVDTAASYGESEQVIGELVAELKLRDKLFLATKFTANGGMGPPPGGVGGPPPGFGGPPGRGGPGGGPPPGGPPPGMGGPPVGGTASFERSLERLKTDHIDLLYVHNLSGTDELFPRMLEWKKAKRVRYLGVSTASDEQHAALVAQMQKYPLDFVEVNYGIGGRAAEQTVLKTAAERRIAVVANVPFGGRGGRTLAAVQGKPLPPWAAEIGCSSWAQVMLKYAMSHPAVTCVISGSTKASHVEDNQQAGRGVLPDAALRKRMEQYWDALG